MAGVPYTTGQLVGATDLNTMSGGTLGYAQITADSGSPGATPLVIAGLSTTVTQSAGRRLRISVDAGTVAAGGAYPTLGSLYIYSGSGPSQIHTCWRTFQGAHFWSFQFSIVLPNVAAGSVSYAVYAAISSGTIQVKASTTQPAYILVEDIGV